MVVRTTGPLSLTTDIRGEFGGATPHSLTEYYRDGGLVSDNDINAGVPTTGQVDFSDFRGASNTIPVSYEIIGGGGGGGGGIGVGLGVPGNANPGSAGQATTISIGNTLLVSSPGGAGGGVGTTGQAHDGERSFYGNGGAGGADSDTNRQTNGSIPPFFAYGAGGGGGGSNDFADYNGGFGGQAGGTPGAAYTVTEFQNRNIYTRNVGMPSTGTLDLVPGTVLTIVVGDGGAGGGGGVTSGADGYFGSARIVIGGTTRFPPILPNGGILPLPGTFTFTVPSE